MIWFLIFAGSSRFDPRDGLILTNLGGESEGKGDDHDELNAKDKVKIQTHANTHDFGFPHWPESPTR